MTRKFIAMLAAASLAGAALAPAAEAREHRGDRSYGHERHYSGRDYDHRYDNRRRRDDHDDALAAGVLGLVLGLALGAAASESNDRRDARCTDNYQRCDARQGYDDGYYENSRDRYERDYGHAPPPPRASCYQRERQWDRYAQRYVTVDVPC